jgi:hypothetical protein
VSNGGGGPAAGRVAAEGSRVKDTEPTDLPQPGLDEASGEGAEPTDEAHPTEGPGNVSVDEPTDRTLDPDAEHEEWPNG